MNSKSKYDLWNSIGNPKYALAPMVDVNDLNIGKKFYQKLIKI